MRPDTARRSAALVAIATLAVLGTLGTIARPPMTATADDAGKGIHTEKNSCVPAAEPGERRLDCIVIYRNTTHRPVFDISIDVQVGGQHGVVADGRCCPRGTRQALAPGESAVFVGGVAVPDGVGSDASVVVTYRATFDGDASAVDVPRPELQYVDRAVEQGAVVYRSEVRNIDGRTWREVSDDFSFDGSPIAVFFSRGAIVGANAAHRWPAGRIAADGRSLLVAEPPPGTESDSVRFFFREAFRGLDVAHVQETVWDLVSLDYGVRSEPGESPKFRYTFTLRNPTALINYGNVHLITRRADFHAISGDQISVGFTPPGGEFREAYYLQGLFPGYTFDDIRFVTLELGGSLGRIPTPAPTASPTSCPQRGTPAPVPTLPAVVARALFPWAGRMWLGACP